MGMMGRTSALDHFHMLEQKMGDAPEGGGQSAGSSPIYWYVFCMQCGKKAMLGPYNSQSDASAAAQKKMSGWTYKVMGFHTRDRAKAVQMLKHDIAHNGAAGQALQSMQHTV